MIKYIKSINNTYHIALYNYENSLCYHVSVVQILHTSPTLNKLLETINSINNEYINDILKPLIIYNKYIPDDNELSIYEQIKDYYKYFVNKYLTKGYIDGYSAINVLVYIFIPAIYFLFPNDIYNILSEIHINPIHFNNIEYVIKNIILTDNYFIEPYCNEQYNLYKKFINEVDLNKIDYKNKFVASTLEIFPQKKNINGHAITLIKTQNMYYIIDDQNSISELKDYFPGRNIDHIYIKNIDEESINEVSNIMRCNYSKTTYKFKMDKFNSSINLFGGHNDTINKLIIFLKQYYIYIICVIIIISLLIYVIINGSKNR